MTELERINAEYNNPETWVIEEFDWYDHPDTCDVKTRDDDGLIIAIDIPVPLGRRMKAAMAAIQGIPTETLETGVIQQIVSALKEWLPEHAQFIKPGVSGMMFPTEIIQLLAKLTEQAND